MFLSSLQLQLSRFLPTTISQWHWHAQLSLVPAQHSGETFHHFFNIPALEPIGGSTPKFSSDATENILSDSDRPLSMACPAQASPLPTYRWSRPFNREKFTPCYNEMILIFRIENFSVMNEILFLKKLCDRKLLAGIICIVSLTFIFIFTSILKLLWDFEGK